MSITTKDIFDTIKSDVVIIKIDVEGHECKVGEREVVSPLSDAISGFTSLRPGQVDRQVRPLHLHGVGQPQT